VISGAREARPSFLRRLVSRAAARDLHAFVVPGPEVARAHGLDLGAASLQVALTPRHANVVLIVGELPEGLREAAAVAYAQMPRPRAVLAAGTEDVSSLPGPDVSVDAGQESLSSGVAELRRRFAEGAFALEAEGFEAATLHSKTEYTCSMHPEVIEDEPGICPKCGMELVLREAGEEGNAEGGHEGHDHAYHEHTDHGEEAGEDDEQAHGEHGQGNHGHAHHGAEDEHGGPEHDEGSEESGEGHAHHDAGDNSGEGHDGQGDEEHGHEEHGDGHEGMGHGGYGHGNHGGMGFMSMVEMTQGTPRSSDGLQMEWVETPFGPLFPGLPGGLALTFTLDGDVVAETEADSAVAGRENPGGPVEAFIERFAGLDPLSPVSYRLLALRAVESAAGVEVDNAVGLARVSALEHERAASHLNWLANFGYLIGYSWLSRRAEELQLALLPTGAGGVDGIRAEVRKLARRVERTLLLRRKLAGVGELPDLVDASGPVARAGGRGADARTDEEVYRSLDFEPVVEEGSDALARLRVRLAETERSLELVRRAGEISVQGAVLEARVSGSGAATVETPRGAATLAVTLEGGEVTVAELETPSMRHIRLVGAATDQQEVADALVGVASLDLSPWGMPAEVAG
jgi:Ni,Fe-hydrogenase III large subunit